jgi:hypothetical protein
MIKFSFSRSCESFSTRFAPPLRHSATKVSYPRVGIAILSDEADPTRSLPRQLFTLAILPGRSCSRVNPAAVR